MTMNAQKCGWMVVAAAVLAAGATANAQGPGVTFKATASVKAPGKSASVPVTIRIERFVSDAERDTVVAAVKAHAAGCLLYTSPSPRDRTRSRMPSSA